jgi:DNA-binding NarL/FixJ family response regulator
MQISPATAASSVPSAPDRSFRSLVVTGPERRRGSRRSVDLNRSLLAALAQWLIEDEHEPTLIVQAPNRVLLMNEAARSLLCVTRAIRLRSSTVEFASKGHRAQLARVLRGEADKLSFNVRVAGVDEKVTLVRVQTQVTAKCARIAVSSSHALTSRLLAEADLTSAEAEIALAIYRGLTLQQVADERGSSINTVKTQLRYIFNKVGVRSKSALTRRIGELRIR